MKMRIIHHIDYIDNRTLQYDDIHACLRNVEDAVFGAQFKLITAFDPSRLRRPVLSYNSSH